MVLPFSTYPSAQLTKSIRYINADLLITPTYSTNPTQGRNVVASGA